VDKDRTLLLPDNFVEMFEDFLKDDRKRFLILPLTLKNKNNCKYPSPEEDHTNMLLYDKETDIMERFEPHGNITTYPNFYETTKLDEELKKLFSGVKYLPPLESCPQIGPQTVEIAEKLLPNVRFCTIWSYWYINLRLANPDVENRVLLQKIAIDKIRRNTAFL
jgi:hypothetical protein